MTENPFSPETQRALSVTGEQLRALAMLDRIKGDLVEGWIQGTTWGEKLIRARAIVASPLGKDRVATAMQERANRTLSPIEASIRGGRIIQAKSDLAQMPLPSQYDSRFKPSDIAAILDQKISVAEVLGVDESRPFVQFVQSLNLEEIDTASQADLDGQVIIPELLTAGLIHAKRKTIRLSTRLTSDDGGYWNVELPLGEQHLTYIRPELLFGSSGEESLQSKLEVFGAVARQTDHIYTHITNPESLLQILMSGYLGSHVEKGNIRGKGLYNEEVTLADADYFDAAIAASNPVDRPAMPLVTPNGNSSFTTARYLKPEADDPVVIMKDTVTQNHTRVGEVLIGSLNLTDPDVLGVWVTPTFRKHLLHWIDTWTDEKRKEVFGDRDPGSFLLSSEDHVNQPTSA